MDPGRVGGGLHIFVTGEAWKSNSNWQHVLIFTFDSIWKLNMLGEDQLFEIKHSVESFSPPLKSLWLPRLAEAILVDQNLGSNHLDLEISSEAQVSTPV